MSSQAKWKKLVERANRDQMPTDILRQFTDTFNRFSGSDNAVLNNLATDVYAALYKAVEGYAAANALTVREALKDLEQVEKQARELA